MNKVLIVEDDREIRALLAEHLRDNGYEVVELADGLHADKCVKEDGIELVLLDLMLPFKSGDQVLRDIRKITNIPVIIICCNNSIKIILTKICRFIIAVNHCISRNSE